MAHRHNRQEQSPAPVGNVRTIQYPPRVQHSINPGRTRRHIRTYLFLTLVIVLYTDVLNTLSKGISFYGLLAGALPSLPSSTSSSSFFVYAAADSTSPILQAREDPIPPGTVVVEEDSDVNMDGISDPEWVRPYHDGPGYFHNTEQEQTILGPEEDINSPVPSPHEPKDSDIKPPTFKGPKKYLLVDFMLEKGIGEVKFQIESALYIAHLSKRTLVVPPWIYFRGCKNDMLCKIKYKEEDLLTQSAEGIVRRKRWAVPFERIYDIEKMRRHADVVLMDDWIRMMIEREQKNTGEEAPKPISSGLEWLKENRQFSYRAAHNDELLKEFKDVSLKQQDIQQFLYHNTGGTIVESNALMDTTKVTQVFGYPNTFNRHQNLTWRWDFAPNSNFVGVAQTFEAVEEEVLHFSGGIAMWGNVLLNFGSEAARDAYEDVAAKWVQFSSEIRKGADYLVRNLLKYTGGRSYLAVHYRRGPEFLHSPIPNAQGNLANYRLGLGTKDHRSPLLRINSQMMRDHSVRAFPLQDLDEWTEGLTMTAEERDHREKQTLFIQHMLNASPQGQTPLDQATRERYYFMATDEKDLGILESMHEQGALLIGDLMDDYFLKNHLEWMGFPDYYGYLEQLICVKARLFLGSPMSVFSGNILNQRIRNNRYGRLGNGWLYRPVPR